MEIKQKHRKHALRKAVTAAVLAGTAFSSLGGFAGAVTTVKADEYYPRMHDIDNEELTDALGELYKAEETIEEKEASVKDLTEKLETSKKNHAELAEEFEKTKGEYEKELSENDKKLSEAAKQNSDLVTENKELKENLEMAEGISEDLQKKVMKAEQEMKEISAQLEAEKEALEAEKAKLAEAKEANDKLSEERDAAKKEAEKVPELEEQVEKLVEEITAAKKEAEELQAKAEALEKDFEAVKAEKEKLEAEIAKMKEDHQKEVDALNALLADKEKMLKNLQDQLDKAKEEAMKNEQMSQEEKAKLQAELDKAKQELADKIKDMPNKVAPQAEGKANAGQAAPNQNQNNQAQANQTKNANNLPSTGDKPVNPLLVASGLSLMIGAGAFVYAGKRKKG
ncbi:LPXTG cell wall anchor domain-containing protein [Streptococcus uberis]|uniref:LPXTG cell wall anchor domain-containing protein n=1 Tax=Streptococcus uberis TaxID=1349 RepID=UPI0027DDB476|nr:LPXTG cell wall anchor domain-containing protein [Streptococcus uberis]MCK1224660.1 LPXTG cell wall anchor domain-containing protein [Streptococcus uberis]